MERPIYKIATEIVNNWENINYAAKPYLKAMFSLNTIDDMYGEDKGKYIIAYFLGNASSWRGEVARRVKKELKSLIKKEGK